MLGSRKKKRYYTTNVCLICDKIYCRTHGDNAQKCWMLHVYMMMQTTMFTIIQQNQKKHRVAQEKL